MRKRGRQWMSETGTDRQTERERERERGWGEGKEA